MLSFENIIISRFEERHAKVKKAFETFIGDLKKVINVIELLLKNEESNYLIVYEEEKARLSRNCFIVALKNLQIYINSYVLKLIRK
jgi:hypothetical protein